MLKLWKMYIQISNDKIYFTEFLKRCGISKSTYYDHKENPKLVWILAAKGLIFESLANEISNRQFENSNLK